MSGSPLESALSVFAALYFLSSLPSGFRQVLKVK
jgi:hypothetical protein